MATVTSARPGDGFAPHADRHEAHGASLGELLRCAREGRGLTLEGLAKETKIPQRHLEALEYDNLTAVPGAFYRRAEIRAYARAVGLDQSLAMAQLESALKPADAREASRGIKGTRESRGTRRYLLVLAVVTVVAALFGRAIWERTPALEHDTQGLSATDSPSKPGLPVRDASPGTVTGAATASDAGLGVTPATTETRASTDAVTELIVTTEPEGARVTVNGIGWGLSPVTVRNLPPGDKRIRVSRDGYASEERLLRLDEGQRRALEIQLASAP